jgi:hypothetical protein
VQVFLPTAFVDSSFLILTLVFAKSVYFGECIFSKVHATLSGISLLLLFHMISVDLNSELWQELNLASG